MASGGVDEEELRERVGHHPIDLLRHRAVEAAEPRLDVADRDLKLGGNQGSGEGRVHVARDKQHVGSDLDEDGLEALHRARRLLGVRPGTNVQHVVRPTHAELLEEDRRHVVVVVLTRVDENRRRIDPGVG